MYTHVSPDVAHLVFGILNSFSYFVIQSPYFSPFVRTVLERCFNFQIRLNVKFDRGLFYRS
jgi:hypothetical protein